MNNEKKLEIRLPEELLKQVQEIAKKEDLSCSAVGRKALKLFIEHYFKKIKEK